MKIIHCADLHLDSKMTANLTREQARERRKEIIRTFTRMVEYAETQDVRAILIAGDLFDTRSVSAMARNTVKDMICTHPQIDFLYLRGNHDSDNFLSKMEEIPENLLLFGDQWTAYRYGSIVISGLELSAKNSATVYNSLVLNHDDFNIVTLHGQLENYAGKEQVERIGLSDLRNHNIDYLALGHVHTFVMDKLDNRGIYCYPGCLEGRGFDECGPKGFVLLDINEQEHRVQTTFVPIAARTFYTIEVDVSGVMTTREAAVRMEQAIAKTSYSSGSLVKFVLTGEVEVDAEINCDYLRDLFTDYFYFEKVYDRTHLRVDYREYENDASLKGEFIRMVLGSELSEEQKAEVIRCGILALSGEEI
ncbi:MAG: metallophosphoesterase [Lachnospiraceae bacterium]|nr:metallophosphoesterase [Lachnospiraceae bacterium]